MSESKSKSPRTALSQPKSAGTSEALMAEMLRTNQLQMEMLANLAGMLGKLTDLLVPTSAPEALTGRFDESWTLEKEEEA